MMWDDAGRRNGIAVRPGHSCTQTPDEKLGLEGTAKEACICVYKFQSECDSMARTMLPVARI